MLSQDSAPHYQWQSSIAAFQLMNDHMREVKKSLRKHLASGDLAVHSSVNEEEGEGTNKSLHEPSLTPCGCCSSPHTGASRQVCPIRETAPQVQQLSRLFRHSKPPPALQVWLSTLAIVCMPMLSMLDSSFGLTDAANPSAPRRYVVARWHLEITGGDFKGKVHAARAPTPAVLIGCLLPLRMSIFS